jgi:hypothetical protein
MIANSTKQCDSGSLNGAGGGCSSTCTIQLGFTCNNTLMPSACISLSGYTISTQSLSKDPTSNLVTAVLQISPVPPSQTVPTLINLQGSLSLQSYTLQKGTLTLQLNLLQSVFSNDQLKVQLSQIN